MIIADEVKIGAVLALGAGLFFGGWYLGSLRGKAELAQVKASQASAVATAVLEQQQRGNVELARVNEVIQNYESQSLDPILLGSAHRLLDSARADCPRLPTGGGHPPGARDPGTQSGDAADSQREIERATQDHFDACAADARQLNALIKSWPR